ncbi:hypothetical protein [Mycolicibacterium llatzerense]|uniref:hypothetical protein n=1 Tax=Mycolicibacterium llatzerense TaxID=280871 RepID=UPI0021B6A263|nr:hypothetical protein [Mycolicibacterium llatzerense]MCT7372947.1 hypothetical protein [Mycolicibacterium llatzerense]
MPNYDAAHKARRRREQKNIDAGHAYCWRCTKHIPPGTDWDLGHDDNDPTKYMGPEHVGCNRATSTHKAMTVTDNSRDW